jgi:exonuclease SbcC
VRPLKLELEGFTAFRDRTCLDFSGLDLFAITGPTGAGKSSLIDAIAFALYGQVPRIENEVKACISQGRDRMWVRFEFVVGEGRYRVHRETGTKAARVRLERARGDHWDSPDLLGERAGEVKKHIERILGLDFDGFTRAVLLPQGEFAEFLAGSPDKRREVLQGLLRLDIYDRVQSRARASAAELHQQIVGAGKLLAEHYADATPENLARCRDELRDATARIERLVQEIDALASGVALAKQVADARAELDGATRELKAVQAEMEGARGIAQAGEAKIAEIQERIASLEAQLRANRFDADRYAALAGAAPIAQSLETERQKLRDTRVQIVTAQKSVQAATQGQEEAQRHAEEARVAREAAEEAASHAMRHNMAAALQQGLALGDACPVCGGAIGELPTIECPDLNRARAEQQAARDADQAAQTALARAATALARAEETAGNLERTAQQIEEHGGELAARLVAALAEDGDRSFAAIQTSLKAQREAQAERQRLDNVRGEAIDAREGLQRALNDATQKLVGLEERLRATAEKQEAAKGDLAELVEKLAGIAAAKAWDDIIEKLRTEAVSHILDSRLRAVQGQQGQLRVQQGQLVERIQQIDGLIEKRRQLEQELEATRAEHNVAADLAQAMGGGRFQTFVQGEALRILADEGSRKLEQLSAGRYRLAVADTGKDFAVIDQWNAEDRRSVRTLSGGETFLASLALALALAETLPGLAASQDVALDSIFLDEGFGSLDAEALDRAADALDSLRTADRMVCVITHLKELADRLPHRVVVHKSESGSTVEVV